MKSQNTQITSTYRTYNRPPYTVQMDPPLALVQIKSYLLKVILVISAEMILYQNPLSSCLAGHRIKLMGMLNLLEHVFPCF